MYDEQIISKTDDCTLLVQARENPSGVSGHFVWIRECYRGGDETNIPMSLDEARKLRDTLTRIIDSIDSETLAQASVSRSFEYLKSRGFV